jgi:hypothetical protein
MESKMGFKLANSIVNKYIELMGNPIGYYCYSDLDIIDFCNAAKLIIAYRIYNSKPDVDKYASWADTGITMYSMHFIPDHKYTQLNKLPKDTHEYIDILNQIKINSINDFLSYLGERESVVSFSNYCKQIERDNNFWHKVYERINILCDINNFDEISNYYKNEESKTYENIKIESSTDSLKKQYTFLSRVYRFFSIKMTNYSNND